MTAASIPIACTACKTPLAVMFGEKLHVGACVFDRPTRLVCAVCGKRRDWHPPDVPPISPDR
jgi:hypothetical protein